MWIVGITWIITLGGGGGAKSRMDVRNFNLSRSQVKKWWKIGLNQPSVYIHPFSPTLTINLLFAPLQSSRQKAIKKKKKFWGHLEKNISWGHLLPRCFLPPSYADDMDTQ
jgi:hypothetical protein